MLHINTHPCVGMSTVYTPELAEDKEAGEECWTLRCAWPVAAPSGCPLGLDKLD